MKQNTKKTFRFFLKHVGRYKGLTVLTFCAQTVAILAAMGGVFLFRDFFNILSSGGTKEELIQPLVGVLLVILGIRMIEWLGDRTFFYSIIHLDAKIMANIMDECFEYLHQHSYNFFNNNFTGALVKRVNRMSRSFEDISDKIAFNFYPMGLKLIITISVLTYLHLTLGLIMLVWTVLFLTINYFISIYKLKFDLESAKADTKVTAKLADSITNSVNVKLFAALPFEVKQFKAVTGDWFFKKKRAWMIDAHVSTAQFLFMIVLEVSVLYVAIQLWGKGMITLGDFFLIQTYILEMFRELWMFGRNIRQVYENLADAEEMTEILSTPHEVKDRLKAKNIHITSGRVEFKKVRFAYSEAEEAVIKDLSFIVKPGEKIALIGPSGGGKSTIVKLILRLFDLQKGQILIDNQDIAKVKQSSLRQQITLVPQEPILFHRTLLENIRYGRRDASEKEVLLAAKMAHCDEFIQKFPQGYHTYVGERGVKLSGGQRQRVAIARAILSNAPILILDEATSSLDSESEVLIQQALENLIRQKTTFLIAHRLSTIMNADRIFVLKEGKIVEEGHHADLVNKSGSLYGRLWGLQSGGYL